MKLPSDSEQVGCVTDDKVGADGVDGCALTVVLDDALEVQPPDVAVSV